MARRLYHISITSLVLRRWWHLPLFLYFAPRAFAQAERADGIVSAQVQKIGGAYLTMTVWRDKAAMMAYRNAGVHRRAIRAFRRMATGRVVSLEAEAAPGWEEAVALLEAEGRIYD
ncbi:MAG: hypothetical protein AAFY59_19700 [Pseudomonadota bacterium]